MTVKKGESKLPDILPVSSMYMNSFEKKAIEVATKYNKLPKNNPKRKELFKEYEDLVSRDLWD